MSVQAFGGFFFRCREPEVLQKWYSEHLGLSSKSQQTGGPLVFQPFPSNSNYFSQDKSFMLNLRVDDIVALITRLEAAGIKVERNPDWDGEFGKFARIHDPEGNPIELWEPKQI